MENKLLFHSFEKIETKADVLKYALEFTQIDGEPNYDEAKKMFEFFTSLVNVPEERENYMKPLLEVIDKMNTNKN